MEQHPTWNSAAEEAVDAIFQNVRTKPRINLEDLRNELDDFIDNLYTAPAGFTTAKRHWANIGANAAELAAKNETPLQPSEILATLIRKQADYGPENIRRFGRQGLLIRTHDKIARLENLTSAERSPANESIQDTYVDIIGYSAIGIMWEDGNFMLPFEAPPEKV